MKSKDEVIIQKLREDASKSLSSLARELDMPVSTLADRINRLKKQNLIKKYTVLIDYLKAGFNHIVNIVINVEREGKKELKEFLLARENVNNLYEAGDGYTFVVDSVHRNMREYIEFKEELMEFKIKDIKENIVLDDLKREAFMSDMDLPPL